MVFSSSEFLFMFLPLYFAVYLLVPRVRNFTLLAFSLAFYFVGEGAFVLVMLCSVTINFLCGLFLEGPYKKLILFLGISLNLVLLIYFKYIGFILVDVLRFSSLTWSESVHLPIGISFFTFQGISYLADVYRGDAKKEKSFVNLATYISMFPQLIAGPIVRYSSVAKSLSSRRVTARNVYYGVMFFCTGLASKVLLADSVALIADRIFSTPVHNLHASAAWLGGLAYSFQIFFDFSGYSSMAIGVGLLIGFKFPQNFNYPYIAKSITEFWRRWHMSLSTWFRDYLYIPLGGNRGGGFKTYRNLATVFIVTGVWHGAAWNFVIWGLWHGFFICIEKLGVGVVLKKSSAILCHAYTILIVYVGWILFRAQDLPQAISIVRQHFDFTGGVGARAFLNNESIFILLVCFLASTPLLMFLFDKISVQPRYHQMQVSAGKSRYFGGGVLHFCYLVHPL